MTDSLTMRSAWHLRCAGWTAQRQVDVDGDLEQAARSGWNYSNVSRRFLSEFSGIAIERSYLFGGTSLIKFGAGHWVIDFRQHFLEYGYDAILPDVIPVGGESPNLFWYLMRTDGVVFTVIWEPSWCTRKLDMDIGLRTGTDGYPIYRLGKTGYDAINNVCRFWQRYGLWGPKVGAADTRMLPP